MLEFRNLAAFAAVSLDFEPRYDHVSRPSSGFRSGAARGDIRRLGLPKSEILPGERTRAVGTRRGRDCIGVSASAASLASRGAARLLAARDEDADALP